jgi:6-phosphofructokinase 1
MLCTRLGTKAAELLAEGVYNVMVAVRGEQCVPVPLEKVAGKKKTVPLDHPWIAAARLVGTCLGDRLEPIGRPAWIRTTIPRSRACERNA